MSEGVGKCRKLRNVWLVRGRLPEASGRIVAEERWSAESGSGRDVGSRELRYEGGRKCRGREMEWRKHVGTEAEWRKLEKMVRKT